MVLKLSKLQVPAPETQVPLARRRSGQTTGVGWVIITEAGRAMQARMWSVYAGALQLHIGDKLAHAQADQLAELLAVLSQKSGC